MSNDDSNNDIDANNGSSDNDESFRKAYNLKAFGDDLSDNSTQSHTLSKTSRLLLSTNWHKMTKLMKKNLLASTLKKKYKSGPLVKVEGKVAFKKNEKYLNTSITKAFSTLPEEQNIKMVLATLTCTKCSHDTLHTTLIPVSIFDDRSIDHYNDMSDEKKKLPSQVNFLVLYANIHDNHFGLLLFDLQRRIIIVPDGHKHPPSCWREHIIYVLINCNICKDKQKADDTVDVSKFQNAARSTANWSNDTKFILQHNENVIQTDPFHCGPIAYGSHRCSKKCKCV